ncbi:MAG: indolepyruvate ferredoxin oxidoreductase subunit alpha [Treponema sp.]|uniref:indolepyruvate ferredoxin oxidoreductase subunit alpha n=1 Tax=Treponema sp. TaxID=166 RepID=UPI00298E0D4C|nr:indolepyruvate ferredoxin oxidoreductase subunit alpha [Treponema sp.]MBR5933463.1 indolepyruvate ferredoxin oxidoreductase subunit alpha [Treponema sp.]
MKSLMLGNAAVARGLYEAGCSIISSYPGTPSTEITEEAAKYKEIYCEWAPNEKVAMETAFGASLAGKRSFCAMKHVGLNVASDPLYTCSYTGVNAGMVIGVADDAGMHSSQNEQDSRHHAIAAKVPMLEPSDSQESLEFAKTAYELSEKFDTPVLIKMCTRVAHSQSIVDCGERKENAVKTYEKNIAKYVMSPANAIKKHPVVEQRTKDLTAWAETSSVNKVENNNSKIGIITHSTSYQYVKEIFGDSVNVLKLGMVNPLPVELIKKFASGCETVVVVEELDPIIENHCKTIGVNVHGKDILPICGEFSQNLIVKCFKESGIASLSDAVKNYSGETKFKLAENVPVRPPVMCAGCPHRGMFYALSKNKITVLGDIGCYTLGSAAPLNAMEMTLCMGASVSSLHGFNKALKEESEGKTVAVIGDSTFMHSGMTSLATIAYNQSNSTVIIVDNSITGMTGHQQNPTTGKNLYGDPAGRVNLEALVKSMGINRVRVVDPYNIEQCEQALKEELAANEPSVIISRRPCALLKEVKHPGPISVNPDKCKSCKSCMKIGCPAISMKDGKAKVDDTLCVGCKVCTQMCKFDAFNA